MKKAVVLFLSVHFFFHYLFSMTLLLFFKLENGANKPSALRTLILTRKEAKIRRMAFSLFHSPDLEHAILRLEREVETGGLCVRDDQHMHCDVGFRNKVLEGLLAYNPVWLKIGLETVYGQMIHMHMQNGVPSDASIRKFVCEVRRRRKLDLILYQCVLFCF